MKAFVVNKNSITYKINSDLVWGNIFSVPKDFCTYWRHTLVYAPISFIGLVAIFHVFMMIMSAIILSFWFHPIEGFSVIGGVLLIIGITLGIIGFFYYTERFWVNRVLIPLVKYIFQPLWKYIFRWPFVALSWVLTKIFVFIIDIGYYFWKKLPERKVKVTDENLPPKEPSMIMLKYKSLKEKYCPMVVYE